MDSQRPDIKDVLEPDDFRYHPVWAWYEDDPDTSLYVPVAIIDDVVQEDYTYMFVYCTLVINDGMHTEGKVNLTFTSAGMWAYGVTFFRGNEKFIFMGWIFPEYGSLEQLAVWLNKPAAAITPLRYVTPYRFPSGETISGEIELRSPLP